MPSELEHCQPAQIQKQAKSYLYYGAPGTGKTTLALQHPGKRKLVIDVDNKLHEMENLNPKLLEGVDVWSEVELLSPAGIEFVEIDPTRSDPKKGKSTNPKPKGYDRQIGLCNELLRQADKGQYPYDCVIWDSGTRTVDHLMALVLWSHGHGIMTETLWGVFGQNVKNWISGFLRLPKDRILIFHERHVTKKDKKGDTYEEYIRPSCPGQQGLDLGSFFSEVYYFKGRDITTQNYHIQTASDTVLCARTTKGLEYKQTIDPVRIYGA